MNKHQETISNALEIEFETKNNLPAIKEEKNIDVDILPKTNQQNDQIDQTDDYNLARKTFQNLIKRGDDAVENLYDLAKTSESPRSYEALAALMKTVSDTTKELYDLQKKKQEIKNFGKPKNVDQSINVDKAVFVGTTADMLKRIKNDEV